MNILLSSLVERTSLHHDTLIQPFLYCCIRAKGWKVAVVADKNNGTACSHLITLIVLTFSVSDYVLEFRVWAKWALECSMTLDWIAINQRKSGWVLKRHQLLARIKKQQQCGFTCWTGERLIFVFRYYRLNLRLWWWYAALNDEQILCLLFKQERTIKSSNSNNNYFPQKSKRFTFYYMPTESHWLAAICIFWAGYVFLFMGSQWMRWLKGSYIFLSLFLYIQSVRKMSILWQLP